MSLQLFRKSTSILILIIYYDVKESDPVIVRKKLKRGDTVAIVSLSSGMGVDSAFMYRFELGKQRQEEVFGLNVLVMPNAFKGSEYLYNYPEKRAEDLMGAFKDKKIKEL